MTFNFPPTVHSTELSQTAGRYVNLVLWKFKWTWTLNTDLVSHLYDIVALCRNNGCTKHSRAYYVAIKICRVHNLTRSDHPTNEYIKIYIKGIMIKNICHNLYGLTATQSDVLAKDVFFATCSFVNISSYRDAKLHINQTRLACLRLATTGERKDPVASKNRFSLFFNDNQRIIFNWLDIEGKITNVH